jgi:hypothetical protein
MFADRFESSAETAKMMAKTARSKTREGFIASLVVGRIHTAEKPSVKSYLREAELCYVTE